MHQLSGKPRLQASITNKRMMKRAYRAAKFSGKKNLMSFSQQIRFFKENAPKHACYFFFVSASMSLIEQFKSSC